MTKSLFVASPVHDGRVETAFLCGIIDSDRYLRSIGVPAKFYFNSGESLVQRARNNIAKVFLNSVCGETGEPWTHMLMIDQDMGFTAQQVGRVLELADADHQIIAGLAPLKMIDWHSVHRAVKAGASPEEISGAGSRMVVNTLPDFDYGSCPNALVPVKYCGTGFLLLSRTALLRFASAYPELQYQPDYNIGDPVFDNAPDRSVTAFFDVMICPDEKRYLSEDYTFCKRARSIGMEVFVCRDAAMSHIGSHAYAPAPGGGV